MAEVVVVQVVHSPTAWWTFGCMKGVPSSGRVLLYAASEITPVEQNDKLAQATDKRWMPEQAYLHPVESTQAHKWSILHPIQTDFPTKKCWNLEQRGFSFFFCACSFLVLFCFISPRFQAARYR